MTGLPETRDSLIVGLIDQTNERAWSEFVEIYRPVIFRYARYRGLQIADAHDFSQQVLVSVAEAIAGWNREAGEGRFRSWLFRVCRNALVDILRCRNFGLARGGSSVIEDMTNQQGCEEAEITNWIEREYEDEVFRWAAKQARAEFEPDTWDAFWLSTIEEVEIHEVAQRLNRSVGSVYTARSRVMQCLKDKVTEFERRAVQ